MTSHLQKSIDVCEITIPILLTIPISLEPVVMDDNSICYSQEKEPHLSFSIQKSPDDRPGQMPSYQMVDVDNDNSASITESFRHLQSSTLQMTTSDDENRFPMAEVFRPPFNNFQTIPLAQAFCLFLTAGHGEYRVQPELG